jgi:hypothetical protein
MAINLAKAAFLRRRRGFPKDFMINLGGILSHSKMPRSGQSQTTLWL